MSALINSQIPAITTAEQLVAYSGLLIARINPAVAFLESQATSVKAAQVTVGRSADGVELLVIRVAIPLLSDWDADKTKPLWQSVGILSETVVPVAYRAA